jgi:hypothetical protein
MTAQASQPSLYKFPLVIQNTRNLAKTEKYDQIETEDKIQEVLCFLLFSVK